MKAARFAGKTGRPLNRYVTIHLERALGASSPGRRAIPKAGGGPAMMLAQWLKSLRDWLAYHGHEAAFLWVRENPTGEHAHILLHLPVGLKLRLSRQ